MGWIILGVVVVVVGVVYVWAGRHSTVRPNVRGRAIDEAAKGEGAQSWLFQRRRGGRFLG